MSKKSKKSNANRKNDERKFLVYIQFSEDSRTEFTKSGVIVKPGNFFLLPLKELTSGGIVSVKDKLDDFCPDIDESIKSENDQNSGYTPQRGVIRITGIFKSAEDGRAFVLGFNGFNHYTECDNGTYWVLKISDGEMMNLDRSESGHFYAQYNWLCSKLTNLDKFGICEVIEVNNNNNVLESSVWGNRKLDLKFKPMSKIVYLADSKKTVGPFYWEFDDKTKKYLFKAKTEDMVLYSFDREDMDLISINKDDTPDHFGSPRYLIDTSKLPASSEKIDAMTDDDLLDVILKLIKKKCQKKLSKNEFKELKNRLSEVWSYDIFKSPGVTSEMASSRLERVKDKIKKCEFTDDTLENLDNAPIKAIIDKANAITDEQIEQEEENLEKKRNRLKSIEKDVEDVESQKKDLEQQLLNLNSQVSNLQRKVEEKKNGCIESLAGENYECSCSVNEVHNTLGCENSSKDIETACSPAKGLIRSVRDELNAKGHRDISYNDVANLVLCLSQGFLTILAGSPGTGKSSLVAMIARIMGLDKADNKRYCEIPVGKGWTTNHDLIGYYNPFTKSLISANNGMLSCLETIDKNKNSEVKYPYLVLLDEANLSSMECYWSDFMNLCDLDKDERTISLGGDKKFSVDETLRFIATINDDHTTETLSPRLLDRAWIIKLKSSSQDIFNMKKPELAASYETVYFSVLSELNALSSSELDSKVLDSLKGIAELCKTYGCSLSYRIISMVQRYCLAAQNSELFLGNGNCFTALDYAVAQKVLPLLDGYGDKCKEFLEKLRDKYCPEKSMPICHELLKDMLAQGERDMMQHYSFFSR